MTPGDAALLAAAGLAAPDAGRAARAARAVALVEHVLGERVAPGGLRVSPLGAAWSRDLDVHVTAQVEPARLEAAGWVPLERLLKRLGRDGRGRWAIVDGDEVVGALDLHEGPAPEPVAAVLQRAGRRGEVHVREVLELRALRRDGHPLPATHRFVTAAAVLEAALGGDELRAWRPAGGGAPARNGPAPAARRLAGPLRRRTRRRAAVALSGVDGAGKSTVAAHLVAALAAAGVPHGRVWSRPGLGLRGLDRVAAWAKRLLREDPQPGVRRMAAGGAPVRSRRGVLGWAWALAVTVAYLASAWRQHLAAEGLVLHDRHALDAVATLDVLYRGVDLRLHRALVRRLLPRAALAVYLDVPATVAVARKPGDTIGEAAVAAQLAVYAGLLPGAPEVVVLDATQPPQTLALEVLRRCAARPGRAR